MRVAVTGGAGFIGSHLVERLLQAGHDVLCLDNFDPFYPAAVKLTNLSTVAQHPRLAMSAVDLADPVAVREPLGQFRPQIVLHLVATAGVRPSIQRPMTDRKSVV